MVEFFRISDHFFISEAGGAYFDVVGADDLLALVDFDDVDTGMASAVALGHAVEDG
jgi:hypothetical protein